jgi:hypothetical protein
VSEFTVDRGGIGKDAYSQPIKARRGKKSF